MTPSSPGAGWFVRALVCRLGMLRPGQFAILWVDVSLRTGGAPPFVRVTRTRRAMVLEVSANRYLDDACRLSDDDEIHLLELGLHPPVGDTPDFWLVADREDVARCAALVSLVLTEILGVTDARAIAYDGGPVRDPSSSPLLPAPVSLLHRAGSLTVWADYDAAGNLEINGHDLGRSGGAGERAYVLTVPAAAFPLVRAALSAPASVDVRALLTAYGPVVLQAGERRWLDDHAIGYDPHNRVEH